MGQPYGHASRVGSQQEGSRALELLGAMAVAAVLFAAYRERQVGVASCVTGGWSKLVIVSAMKSATKE